MRDSSQYFFSNFFLMKVWTYPCPCGDKFVISREDLVCGEEVARCPSCSLIIKVIYDESFLDKFSKKKDDEETATENETEN